MSGLDERAKRWLAELGVVPLVGGMAGSWQCLQQMAPDLDAAGRVMYRCACPTRCHTRDASEVDRAVESAFRARHPGVLPDDAPAAQVRRTLRLTDTRVWVNTDATARPLARLHTVDPDVLDALR